MVRKRAQPCRTCKGRKVKCDEVWPACNRCVSARRVCDGYGIWGGGGNNYQERTTGLKALSRPTPLRYQIPVSVVVSSITLEEQAYFEWFLRRSIVKLPGVFASDFWKTLVLQASSNEPAVLHAALALGAVHKREVCDIDRSRRSYQLVDSQELFVVRQYSKAINGLQPHLLGHDRESLRIALITCLVFVSLEFLRGHFRIGNIHLQNGLKLVDYSLSTLWSSHDSLDQYIIETFVRLQLQVQMFGQNTGRIYRITEDSTFILPTKFHTLIQARKHLDYLLTEILHLAQLRRQSPVSEEQPPSPELLEAQSHLRAKLGAWLSILLSSRADLRVDMDTRTLLSYKFLSIYHTMGFVMVETCLETTRESIFGQYTSCFISILDEAVNIQNIILSTAMIDVFPGHTTELNSSIIDIGWIPALYYIALKCRVHQIRVHAIKLLRLYSYREGIWDSLLAACIAQKVMEIEEAGFYENFPVNNEFSIFESPNVADLSLPAFPESYLVNSVEVVVPDESTEKANLICKRQGNDGICEIISREVEMWSDGQIDT